ncbi:hypothetical protein [uncultured Treponema sp.]|uniref:hypothetical protein n=1 Tax=uncultured Treponema sp. TaxID=162155 RepID=UPI0025DFF5EA|nr:hypothetical protein [uncultured Treponema sp.]
MTKVYFYLALSAAAAVLIAAVFILAKTVRKKSRKIKELEESVKRQNRSIGFLLKHSNELAEINRGKDELIKKIQEPKSDEDIADIVGGIIELNNGRLRDASKG